MERLSEAFAFLFLGGVIYSLMFFVPLWGPQLVFMRLAARHPAQTRTYTTLDALVLTVYLALANALVALTRNEMETSWLVALALSANVFAILIWIKCQRSIDKPPSRVLVQAILYPLAVIAVGVLLSAVVVLLSLVEVFGNGSIPGARQYFYDLLIIASAVTLPIAITTIFAIRASFHRFVNVGCSDFAIEQSDLATRAEEPADERWPE